MKVLKISCLILAILIPLALGTSAAAKEASMATEKTSTQAVTPTTEGALTAKEAAKVKLAPYYYVCMGQLNLSKAQKTELEIMKHFIGNPYCCYEGQTISWRLDCLKRSYDDLKIIKRTLCMLSKVNLNYDPSYTDDLIVGYDQIFNSAFSCIEGAGDDILVGDEAPSIEANIDAHLSKIKQALDKSYDYFKKIYNTKMETKTKLMELRAK